MVGTPRSSGRARSGCRGAVTPPALLLSEQRRLKVEHVRLEHESKAAAADVTDLEQEIRDALDLLQDAPVGYEQASKPGRKQLNRDLFTRILLGPEPSDIRVELNELYAGFSTSDPEANGVE